MENGLEEFTRKDMAASYDRQAAIYDESRVLFETGYAGRKERESISAELKGSSILECGVGTGRNALYFGKDFTYTGCDLSLNMVKVCNEKTKNNSIDVNLILSDAENLAFKESSFNNIICSRTLKLLPSSSRFIKEARRVLKEGGRCIVTFASLDSFCCRLYYNKIGCKVNKEEKFHYTKEIMTLFQEAGFSNIKVSPVINVPWGLYQALWSFIIYPSQQDLTWQPHPDKKLWSFIVHFKPLGILLRYLNPILEKIASGMDGLIKFRFIVMIVGEVVNST